MLGNAGNVFFPHQALFLVTSKSEVAITCYNMSMFFICKVVIICYYDPLWEPQGSPSPNLQVFHGLSYADLPTDK